MTLSPLRAGPIEFAPDVPSIDYRSWIQRVIGWDAVLPFVISLTSAWIAKAFPNNAGRDVIALAGLPIAGFLIRYFAGRRQIATNACKQLTRRFQLVSLVVGLFALVIVDFCTSLSAFALPQGNKAPAEVVAVCAFALTIYLALATFAMYPGRRIQ